LIVSFPSLLLRDSTSSLRGSAGYSRGGCSRRRWISARWSGRRGASRGSLRRSLTVGLCDAAPVSLWSSASWAN